MGFIGEKTLLRNPFFFFLIWKSAAQREKERHAEGKAIQVIVGLNAVLKSESYSFRTKSSLRYEAVAAEEEGKTPLGLVAKCLLVKSEDER